MAVRLNPYLNFRGTARDALERYQQVFGGELTLSTLGESGMEVAPGESDWLMHGQLETSDGFTLMAADVPTSMSLVEGSAHSVSLSGDDETALRGFWDGLLEGGTVTVPLEQAPWGDTFGMLVDRYGVAWLVNIAGS